MSGGMSFELTEDQELIRKSVAELAGKFDDHYWMEKDLAHEFPQEFYDAIAKGGWLGMTIPEEYGGHGLGITEATLLLEEISRSGGGDERRQCHPPVDLRHAARRQARLRRTEGRARCPGSSTAICTSASASPNPVRDWTPRASRPSPSARAITTVVNGRKVWISKALESEKILLLTRTTPYDEVTKKTDGMTLFLTDLTATTSTSGRSRRWAATPSAPTSCSSTT